MATNSSKWRVLNVSRSVQTGKIELSLDRRLKSGQIDFVHVSALDALRLAQQLVTFARLELEDRRGN